MKAIQEFGLLATMAGAFLAAATYFNEQIPSFQWGGATVRVGEPPLIVTAVVLGGGVLLLIFSTIGRMMQKARDDEKKPPGE